MLDDSANDMFEQGNYRRRRTRRQRHAKMLLGGQYQVIFITKKILRKFNQYFLFQCTTALPELLYQARSRLDASQYCFLNLNNQETPQTPSNESDSDEDVQVDDSQSTQSSFSPPGNALSPLSGLNTGLNINTLSTLSSLSTTLSKEEVHSSWDILFRNQVIQHMNQNSEQTSKFSKFTIENLIKK